MDVLNEDEISILLNSFDNENLIDLKSYIFNIKKKKKVSEDLYNNIIIVIYKLKGTCSHVKLTKENVSKPAHIYYFLIQLSDIILYIV